MRHPDILRSKTWRLRAELTSLNKALRFMKENPEFGYRGFMQETTERDVSMIRSELIRRKREGDNDGIL